MIGTIPTTVRLEPALKLRLQELAHERDAKRARKSSKSGGQPPSGVSEYMRQVLAAHVEKIDRAAMTKQ